MNVPGAQYKRHTLHNGASAVADGLILTCTDGSGGAYAVLTCQIVMVGTATITWEGTIDEVTWSSVPGFSLATQEVSTTATASGIYRIPVTGLVSIRARISSYTSGAVYVYGIMSSQGDSHVRAGGGGVSDHALLSNLDFASAGHTGFLTVLATPTTTTNFAIGSRITPTDTSGTVGGIVMQITANPASASTALYQALTFDVGTLGGNAQNYTGTLNLIGIRSTINHRGSGTVNGSTSLYATNPGNSGGGSITNCYGIFIDNISRGASTNYAIYSLGGMVYFAGSVGFGVTSPTAAAHMAASTTARASLRIAAGAAPTAPNDGDAWNDGNAIVLMVNGTNAVNTDGGLSVWMQSSTTARNVGRLLWQYTDKTDATRATRGSMTAFYTTTEHKPITWGADSGGALLSFYDVTTPIARQVLATGAGATVDDVITALQNLGLVKQS